MPAWPRMNMVPILIFLSECFLVYNRIWWIVPHKICINQTIHCGSICEIYRHCRATSMIGVCRGGLPLLARSWPEPLHWQEIWDSPQDVRSWAISLFLVSVGSNRPPCGPTKIARFSSSAWQRCHSIQRNILRLWWGKKWALIPLSLIG
jgi:hypothetical protein